MNKLIAIVGMCGCGKTTVADILTIDGFLFVRFGQITLNLMAERKLEVTPENEKMVREEVRKEFGMGAYATLNIKKFDELLEQGDVVADGMYSWSEYKILKEKYADRLVTLFVHASPAIRYARLEGREQPADDKEARFRKLTPKESKARDYAEIENIEKAGPMAMADYLIRNEGTLDELEEKVAEFIKWVKDDG